MVDSLKQILADKKVDEAELAALFKTYDTDDDGTLGPEEQRAFARDVSKLIGGNVDDVLAILNFYQEDWDEEINESELRGFLEVYVAD